MNQNLFECKICQSQENIGLNYGVVTCGSCKMFFHRTVFGKKIQRRCKKTCHSKCRSCRFQKCISNGMLYTPNKSLLSQDSQSMLSALIFNLSHIESHRNYQLTSCYLFGDPSISELVKDKKDWKLEPRPQNYRMSCMDWGFISGIVSIDFISKFPFINSLELKNKVILYKKCFFFSSLLFDSLRATQMKQDFICFPDGTEVIQLNAPGVTKHFENNIRSRLAGRANELRITREEVLLLSVIMLCNPSLPNLSKTAQYHLAEYQRIYSSALLQHCLLNYQESGPSRFTDLLSLFHVIVKTHQNIYDHYVISSINGPSFPLKRIFSDE